jgi:hypothetical protein
MKKIKTLLFTIFLLAGSSAIAQTGQLSSKTEQPRKFKHNQQIEEKYDKFDDETTIELTMQLTGTLNKSSEPINMFNTDGLILQVGRSFQGRKESSPASSNDNLIFTETSYLSATYNDSSTLIFLVDGERIIVDKTGFEEAKYVSRPVGKRIFELLGFQINYKTLIKISTAKTVEGRLGKTEFVLTKDQLEAIQDYISRLESYK